LVDELLIHIGVRAGIIIYLDSPSIISRCCHQHDARADADNPYLIINRCYNPGNPCSMSEFVIGRVRVLTINGIVPLPGGGLANLMKISSGTTLFTPGIFASLFASSGDGRKTATTSTNFNSFLITPPKFALMASLTAFLVPFSKATQYRPDSAEAIEMSSASTAKSKTQATKAIPILKNFVPLIVLILLFVFPLADKMPKFRILQQGESRIPSVKRLYQGITSFICSIHFTTAILRIWEKSPNGIVVPSTC